MLGTKREAGMCCWHVCRSARVTVPQGPVARRAFKPNRLQAKRSDFRKESATILYTLPTSFAQVQVCRKAKGSDLVAPGLADRSAILRESEEADDCTYFGTAAGTAAGVKIGKGSQVAVCNKLQHEVACQPIYIVAWCSADRSWSNRCLLPS